MSDFGRDELISARAEKKKLIDGMTTMGKAIGELMEDRVRHVTALRRIAELTNSGYTVMNADVHRIAREALDTAADMSWWPETDGAS